MKITTSFILYLILLTGCKNEKQPVKHAGLNEENKPVAYFPVDDFLRSEIRSVDSLPVGIIKYVTENGKTDSAYIQPEEFHKLAAEFLAEEIRPGQMERNYTENAFYDHSTRSSVFNYTPENNDISLRRIDVLSKEESAYNRVSSIYLEIAGKSTDSFSIKKMMWKPGFNFMINTVYNDNKTTQIKVVWNNWGEEQ